MTELAKRRKVRGGHKARCKTIIQSVDAALEDSPTCEGLSANKTELQRQNIIILKMDEEILQLAEETDMNQEINTSSEFQIFVNTNIRKIDSFLKQSLAGETESHSQNVKLPKINLVIFDGNVLQWPVFWDLFKSSIHSRTDISDISKFHYLVGQLKGEAAQLVSGFEHTDREYTEAVQLLIDTYGKPKRLIQARLDALFALKSPTSCASELSKFRSLYEGHIRGLGALGANITESGYVFAAIIIKKLPEKIRDNINRAHNSDFWDLTDLRTAIGEEIGHLESVGSSKSVYVSDSISDISDVVKYNGGTAAFSVATKLIKCQFCSESHYANKCVKYKTSQDRNTRAKQLKLCFNCLRQNHNVYSCTNTGRCRQCTGKHHSTLCHKGGAEGAGTSAVVAGPGHSPGKREEKSSKPQVSKLDTNLTTTVLSDSKIEQSKVKILPTAILPIISGNYVFKARALFDLCSQSSFILKHLAEKLKLPVVSNVTLAIDGFASSTESKSYPVVKCEISTNAGLVNFFGVVVDHMPERLNMPGRFVALKQIEQLGIKLADPGSANDDYTDIPVLIGVDQFYNFVQDDPILQDLHVLSSNLGALIVGNIDSSNASRSVSVDVTTVCKISSKDVSDCDYIGEQLQQFWQLDAIGIGEPNVEDDISLSNFEQSIKFENGRYTAQLPWKLDHPPLPSNFKIAQKRMFTVLSKLRKDPVQLKQYDNVIRSQITSGFVKEINPKSKIEGGKIHYLAHHGIKKQSSTTPLRVVFDCSAKAGNGSPSLNDCLYSGPSLLNDLVSVFIRFRLDDFACTSDISKAFLMIGLNESDRESTRFLWPADPNDPNSKINTYMFNVVLFGSTSSQFLLNATIRYHLANCNNEVSSKITRSIYVDNILATDNSEQKLIEFYENSKKVMSEAGFQLEQWASNSPILSNLIEGNGDGLTKADNYVSVLGMKWDTNTDNLQYKDLAIADEILTKRSVLSLASKLYDPLGLLLPVTIKGRLFIQELWRDKDAWDTPLTNSKISEWKVIEDDMRKCLEFKIPRKVANSNSNVDLHAFADASGKAYGTCIYLVANNESRLLMSRARIAPIKAPTLPQMELTAVSICARLINNVKEFLKNELNFNQTFIWTDSTIVISWLETNKILKPYIRKRVDEIKYLEPNAIIKHVSSKENAADLLTRGISAQQLLTSDLWWSGPEFLLTSCSNLCSTQTVLITETSLNSNLCVESPPVVATKGDNASVIRCPIEVTRYSSFDKFVRITAYVFKFVKILKSKINKTTHNECPPSELNLSDISSAESYLVRASQRNAFPEVYNYFCSKTKVQIPSIVKQLKLEFVDGIMRCRGRLERSGLSDEAKFPILLSAKETFTKLLIESIHARCAHSGINFVLAELRQKWWIPRARQLVRSVVNKCFKCKLIQGKAFPRPDTAPLPYDRVNNARPFHFTGVDYTGALLVRDGEKLSKVYVALFTCGTTRAVHLELVEDGSKEAFLRAFRRFASRRSYPKIIVSDNAGIFVNTANVLQAISEHPSVLETLTNFKVEWKFIPPHSPWWGGFYERLIGMTKNILKKILGNAYVTFEELRTILVEAEALMNDRPLTYSSTDLEDCEPVTPSLLIYGHRITGLPNTYETDEYSDPNYVNKFDLNKRQQRCNFLLHRYWDRWQREYLTSLRERDRNILRNGINAVSMGDVVLIRDDGPRSSWRMGVIIKLFRGGDDIVRSVLLKTNSGKITRSVVHLYPLEIKSDVDDVKDCQTPGIVTLRRSARLSNNLK